MINLVNATWKKVFHLYKDTKTSKIFHKHVAKNSKKTKELINKIYN